MTTIYQVRARAISKFPYISYALMSAEPIATDHPLPAPFCADQNWHFYYNPDQLEACPTGNACLSYLVETVRLLQRHAQRLNPMVPDHLSGQEIGQTICALASEAIATNVIINNCGDIQLDPKHGYLPVTLESLPVPQFYYSTTFIPNAERVARRLFDFLPPGFTPPPSTFGQNASLPPSLFSRPSPSQGNPGENQSEGDNPTQGTGEGSEQPSPNQLRHHPSGGTPETPPFRSKKQPKPSYGLGGSATDGIPRTWERPELSDASQDTRQRQRNIEVRTAEGIQREIGCGNKVGQTFVEWSEQVMGSVSQKRIANLSSILRSATSYTRGYQLRRYDGRSRRQSALARHNQQRIIRPRWREIRPHIMFILDISGSMGKDEIRLGLKYIAGVLQSIDMTEYCTLWLGNTVPQLACTRITPQSVLKMDIFCNGGTHMPTVCASALQLARTDYNMADPDVIVCVTDGGTSWHDRESSAVYRTRQPFVVALTNEKDDMNEAMICSKLKANPIPDHMYVTTAGEYTPF